MWTPLCPHPHRVMAKKACENYIRLNKKITAVSVITEIRSLSEEWGISEQDVCYRMIAQTAMQSFREREKNPPPSENDLTKP